MLHIISEGGNSQLIGKKFFLPEGIKKKLVKILNKYSNYKDKPGYKRLKNIINMNGIEYNEMKRLKNFFDNYKGDKKDIEYELNGGSFLQSWVNLTLNNATKSIKDFKTAKMNAGIENSFIKKHNKNRNKQNVTNVSIKTGGDISKSISNNDFFKFENIIKEDYDHVFYEYLSEYTPYNVLCEFIDNPNGKESWGPLINPSMYQKALNEFMKFGKFVKFPTKYIYQWFGIIMRNTAKLNSNNELSGRNAYLPTEDIEDFIGGVFSEKYGIKYEFDGKSVNYEINPDSFFSKDAINYLNKYDFYSLRKIYNGIYTESIHKSGDLKGQYNMFLTQDETDEYDKMNIIKKKNESLKKYEECVSFFNENSNKADIKIIDGKIFIFVDYFSFIDIIGLSDWMEFPDGSVAISDFGLEPILKIINEYDSSLPPEKVIVLINKILDIYHQRGDLSSIFIEGGSSSLSKISNKTYENKNVLFGQKQIILIEQLFIE